MRLLRSPLLVGWLLGIGSVVLAAAIVGAYLMLGGYNAAANSQHSKALAWAVHKTMTNSVRRRAAAMPQPSFSEAALVDGMREYQEHCVACHGGPGVDRARWASAMLPTPPFLVGASQRWSRGELYTIVHDGVKMTGMPAWGEIVPGKRIEDVVTLLQAMPKLTPDQFARLRARAIQPQTPKSGASNASFTCARFDGRPAPSNCGSF